MSGHATAETHRRRIRALNEAADWSGLVRYWLVHGEKPARNAAVKLLKAKESTDLWIQLASALEESEKTGLVSTDEISRSLLESQPLSEQITVDLLSRWPALLFLTSARRPLPISESQLNLAVQACERGTVLALSIADKELAAILATATSRGFAALSQWNAALEAGKVAVKLQTELASQEPTLHLAGLNYALLNLVRPSLELKHAGEAVAYARRAVLLANNIRKSESNKSLSALGNSLHHLAFALKTEARLLSANYCLRKVITLMSGSPEQSPQLAAALDMHSSVAESLGRLDEAERSCRLLLDMQMRSEAKAQPSGLFVVALARLASIQIRQGHFANALNICVQAFSEIEKRENEASPTEKAFLHHLCACGHYGMRKLNEAKANCDQAIELLKHFDDSEARFEQAKTLDSRSIILRELGHVEAALEDVSEAVKILGTLSAAGTDVQSRLAHCLSSRGIILATLGHWKAAQASFEAALVQLDSMPRDGSNAGSIQSMARSLLSLSYVLLKLGDAAHAERRAREARNCLHHMNKTGVTTDSELYSLALLNEGTALLCLRELDAAQARFEEAIAIHRAEWRRNPDAQRGFIARLLLNIGLVQFDRGDRHAAKRSAQMAVKLFRRNARDQPSGWHTERLQALSTLGRLLSASESPDDSEQTLQALAVFDEAAGVAEEWRTCFFDPGQLRRVQLSAREAHEGRMWNLLTLASQTHSEQPLQDAFLAGESSRARNLDAMLSEERMTRAEIPPVLAAEFWNARRQLRAASRNLHAHEAGLTNWYAKELPRINSHALRDTFRTEKSKHDDLLRAIQHDYPDFRPGHSVRPRTFEEIRSVLPKESPTAFIQYNVLEFGCIALIVTKDCIDAVQLKCGHAQIRSIAARWMAVIESSRGSDKTAAPLSDSIPLILDETSKLIVWPLLPWLRKRGVRKLVISPNRELHLLPVQACPLEDGYPLSDSFEVSFAPSFSVFHHCTIVRHSESRRLLVAANPTADLPFSELEAGCAQKFYADSTVLMFRQVTKARLRKLAAKRDVIYYTGHVAFDGIDPANSALVLEHRSPKFDHRWLTLRDVLLNFEVRPGSLVILNGCESGLLNPDEVDDYINLPVGFLLAGASGVLSTMWPVPDFSSALLMRQFHWEWNARGQSISGALRNAQRWLRDEVKTGIQLQKEIVPSLLNELPQKHLQDLCRSAGDHYANTSPTTPPFASPLHWAPYQLIGQSL